jgi:predicted GH43/DUF377 family glycosyl hydrolase
MSPGADDERCGDAQDLAFPCGSTVGANGDTVNLYYAAADSSIALTCGSIHWNAATVVIANS